MKTTFKKVLALGTLGILLNSCSKTSFSLIDQPSINLDTDTLFESQFKIESSMASFDQPQLESNETQIAFQVVLPDGSHVTDLKASEIKVVENDQDISNFQLQSNSVTHRKTVDIIFAVDVTASMSPTIESAKSRLINFVNKSRQDGYRTRMCLITFGDYTVKNCDRFYDNNPQDAATETQVTELISEITKLKALTGASDPGGKDFNENPMRALIDASKAPWADLSERYLILVTDDGFLYSPGNQGAVGDLAPQYSEVLQAIQSSQMKVFAATPSKSGYNRNFQGSAGIVEASQGEWFNFSKLISGEITLDTILGRIMSNVQTTYLVQYTLDESSGLDPSLALSKRKIEVLLPDGQIAKVKILSKQSNLPEGRAQYKKKFKITEKEIKKDSLVVKIDGVVQTSGFTVEENGQIEFKTAPHAKAKIELLYQYKNLKDSVQLRPVELLVAPTETKKLKVRINGIEASKDFFELKQTLEGQVTLVFKDGVLAEDDPFRIDYYGGVTLKIEKLP